LFVCCWLCAVLCRCRAPWCASWLDQSLTTFSVFACTHDRLLRLVQVHAITRPRVEVGELGRGGAVHHKVPSLRAVSSSKVRRQTAPRPVLFPPVLLTLHWLGLPGRRLELSLFPRTGSDLVLEEDLHPAVLQYMRDNQLYMFAPAAVGKRNRSRLYVFAQLVAAAALVLQDLRADKVRIGL
jgi:hypothetical protein